MKRRDFLKNGTLASTAFMAPSFLKWGGWQSNPVNRTGKIFVVIQLSGGNDGLNTIIPYRNDIYYRERPSLAIPQDQVLGVSDELGFHPSLAGLQELYDEGWVSILNNVGYPNPDRSHFRSMDIWHTASDSDTYWSTGWLGRYLDSQCDGCANPHHALEMDSGLSLALRGELARGFAVTNPRQMERASRNPLLQYIGHRPEQDHEHEHVGYLYKMLVDTQESTDYLSEHSNQRLTREDYPGNAFGNDLKQVAELILAGGNSKVYYISLGGFDTHANQQNTQARLLQQYADGVKAFMREMERHGLLNDTLVLTFSEFGRRVAQNGSRGTDHGTANNLFLLGGNLQQPGFFNSGPNLTDLDEGDLRYQLDFRQVYATVLENWLDASPSSILNGEFTSLNLL